MQAATNEDDESGFVKVTKRGKKEPVMEAPKSAPKPVQASKPAKQSKPAESAKSAKPAKPTKSAEPAEPEEEPMVQLKLSLYQQVCRSVAA